MVWPTYWSKTEKKEDVLSNDKNKEEEDLNIQEI